MSADDRRQPPLPVFAHDVEFGQAATMATHLLFESASGYAIFEVKQHEEIGAKTDAVQKSIEDLATFGKMVSLVSFSPFKSAAHALENANDVSEGMSYFYPRCWSRV